MTERSPDDDLAEYVQVLRGFGLSEAEILELHGDRSLADGVALQSALDQLTDDDLSPDGLYDRLHASLARSSRGIDATAQYWNRVPGVQLGRVLSPYGYDVEVHLGETGHPPFTIVLHDRDRGTTRRLEFAYPGGPLGENNYPALVYAVETELLKRPDLTFVLLTDEGRRWRFVLVERSALNDLKDAYGGQVEVFGRPLLRDHQPADFASGAPESEVRGPAATGNRRVEDSHGSDPIPPADRSGEGTGHRPTDADAFVPDWIQEGAASTGGIEAVIEKLREESGPSTHVSDQSVEDVFDELAEAPTEGEASGRRTTGEGIDDVLEQLGSDDDGSLPELERTAIPNPDSADAGEGASGSADDVAESAEAPEPDAAESAEAPESDAAESAEMSTSDATASADPESTTESPSTDEGTTADPVPSTGSPDGEDATPTRPGPHDADRPTPDASTPTLAADEDDGSGKSGGAVGESDGAGRADEPADDPDDPSDDAGSVPDSWQTPPTTEAGGGPRKSVSDRSVDDVFDELERAARAERPDPVTVRRERSPDEDPWEGVSLDPGLGERVAQRVADEEGSATDEGSDDGFGSGEGLVGAGPERVVSEGSVDDVIATAGPDDGEPAAEVGDETAADAGDETPTATGAGTATPEVPDPGGEAPIESGSVDPTPGTPDPDDAAGAEDAREGGTAEDDPSPEEMVESDDAPPQPDPQTVEGETADELFDEFTAEMADVVTSHDESGVEFAGTTEEADPVEMRFDEAMDWAARQASETGTDGPDADPTIDEGETADEAVAADADPTIDEEETADAEEAADPSSPDAAFVELAEEGDEDLDEVLDHGLPVEDLVGDVADRDATTGDAGAPDGPATDEAESTDETVEVNEAESTDEAVEVNEAESTDEAVEVADAGSTDEGVDVHEVRSPEDDVEETEPHADDERSLIREAESDADPTGGTEAMTDRDGSTPIRDPEGTVDQGSGSPDEQGQGSGDDSTAVKDAESDSTMVEDAESDSTAVKDAESDSTVVEDAEDDSTAVKDAEDDSQTDDAPPVVDVSPPADPDRETGTAASGTEGSPSDADDEPTDERDGVVGRVRPVE